MRKGMLVIALGGLLLGGSGLASAAETGPLALTDSQMDQVAAGAFVASWSNANAGALLGVAATGSQTYAFSTRRVSATGSTSVGGAIGLLAGASSSAGSVIIGR